MRLATYSGGNTIPEDLYFIIIMANTYLQVETPQISVWNQVIANLNTLLSMSEYNTHTHTHAHTHTHTYTTHTFTHIHTHTTHIPHIYTHIHTHHTHYAPVAVSMACF